MSTLDQDDVFADGPGDETDTASAFNHVNTASAAPSKPKGKTIAGMSIGMWAMMLGVTLFMGYFVMRTFTGGGGGDEAQMEGMADSSMSLEAVEPTPEQAAETEAPEQAGAETAPPAFVAPPAIDPTMQAVTNPDAAQLAVQPAAVPAIAAPVATPAQDPLAAARQARLPQEAVTPQPAVQMSAPVAPAIAVPAQAASPTVAPVAAANAASQAELAQLRAQVQSLQAEVASLKSQKPATVASAPRAARAASAKPRTSTAASSKPTRQTPPSTASAKPAAPVAGVSLRAVVGDTAWVQTTAGESIQVRNGDVIPGVGTVKGINAESAQVQLDDGRVLK
ncbi:hypothetical protein LJR168_003830 [Pseudoxanthomonas sp. LjRoot168]|uniref:hypothetical protein n=1 Tax=unclassified Pseudoxanthomonas TaxID=2645906 RepID=UPI003ECDCC42